MKLNRLNNLEKKNRLLFYILRVLRKIYISLQDCCLRLSSWLRLHGFRETKYKELFFLRNSHQDERCFILCTGPSLTLEDILMLSDEFTFGMNSISLLFEKTDWRPSFYGVQDEGVYEILKDSLKAIEDRVWVSSNIWKNYKDSRIYKSFPLNSKYNYYDYRYTSKLHVKFSNNAYSVVFDAYSITFSLIQIAVYMGFKEIYLLGCDCNQKVGQKNHFIESGHSESDDKLRTSAERNIFSHVRAKEFCEKNGVRIFNATRGGMLEVYERKSLEEILSCNCEKGVKL